MGEQNDCQIATHILKNNLSVSQAPSLHNNVGIICTDSDTHTHRTCDYKKKISKVKTYGGITINNEVYLCVEWNEMKNVQ